MVPNHQQLRDGRVHGTAMQSYECSSQGMHRVLCEFMGGSSLSLGAGKGLMEEMLLFELGLWRHGGVSRAGGTCPDRGTA